MKRSEQFYLSLMGMALNKWEHQEEGSVTENFKQMNEDIRKEEAIDRAIQEKEE